MRKSENSYAMVICRRRISTDVIPHTAV